MTKKLISFVIPAFNEEGNVPTLYARLVGAMETRADSYESELIFIDDGSTDATCMILNSLRLQDSRVKVLPLSRNFGHQIAVTAGLDFAEGDAVVIIDADLQDPPEISLELIARWETGAQVVYAQRRSRKDSAFKRATAHFYYSVLAKVSNIDIPRNTGDFRLLDRVVVDELVKFREQNRFIRGMVSSIGFRQEAVQFDRDSRFSGKSHYPISKMMRLALDGILGFSTLPLRLISAMGIFFALISFVWTICLVFAKIVAPSSAVEGWTFIVVGMFLIGGIQMMMLGVLGGYIGRIYTESQSRPLYAINYSKLSE